MQKTLSGNAIHRCTQDSSTCPQINQYAGLTGLVNVVKRQLSYLHVEFENDGVYVQVCDGTAPRQNMGRRDLHKADLREVDWPRVQLSGSDLTSADLSRANLAMATLQYARLEGTKLVGAKLDGASLKGSCLVAADLRGASLHGVYLGDVDLSGADLCGADLRKAFFLRTSLCNARYDNTTRWPVGFVPPPEAIMV